MPKFSRRILLRLAAAGAALPAIPDVLRADSYPSRPVHIVTGYPAGASPDIIARLIADALSRRVGQQFIVDNRPGAGSNIGTEVAAHSAPDGYTLLIAVSTNAINASLYTRLNFDFNKDFAPVARIGVTPFVAVSNPAFPPKTIPELIAYSKAHPGQVNFATQGVGTGPHVAAELFKMMTGADLVHVPYKGNYNPDLLGGQIPLCFASIAQEIEFVKDGRLRCIAVTTAARSDALPDVPTIGEFVPGYVAVGWYGIVVPTGTPGDIIAKLADAVIACTNEPDVSSKLLAIGVVPRPMTTPEFGTFIADETEKWAKVIKFADMRVD
ncbi:MAG TPA: tripartite tricarboxylate transporter substrate binding protein [Pseudolabrys sp.]|jgi:tripartite-type tricarboxylate transporter receptor subunit TctC|nr:tripartite tricarboxylate transporter substrate binding protein [Pseudolabrys sp.]